jgi:hypothetical protein
VHWVLYIYGRKSFPLGWCRGAKFIDCLIDDFTFKWRRKCWGIKIVSYLNRRGHNNEKRWLCGSGGEERAGVCIRYKKAGDLYIDRIQYNFVGSNLMTVWINVSDTLFSLPPFSFCLIHVASKLRLMTWSCKFFLYFQPTVFSRSCRSFVLAAGQAQLGPAEQLALRMGLDSFF